jgi:hypothetical protein
MSNIKFEPGGYVYFLRLLLGFSIFATVIMTSIYCLSLFVDIFESNQTSWPVTSFVNDSPETQYDISANLNTEVVSLVVNQGSIKFYSTSVAYRSISILSLLLYCALTVGILLMLYRISGDLSNSDPFTRLNISRLNKIAFIIFLFFPVDLIHTLTHHWYITNHIEILNVSFDSIFNRVKDNAQLSSWIKLNSAYEGIEWGYILLVLATGRIFSMGVKLKEDSESIL